jgi:predicted nucleic acid-binding protein
MTRGLTLDAGALIAAERGDGRVIALLERVLTRGAELAIPAGALAQAWRADPKQHRLHRLLGDERCDVVALDRDEALRVGALCARTGRADIVDVSVAACASRRGHVVVTADADDIAAVDPTLRLIVL